MINEGLFTNNSDIWETPQDLFNGLNKIFNFTLDACAQENNAKVKKYYTPEKDGLMQDWANEIVFCNPPYSNIKNWVKKCYDETKKNKTTKIILLIPARTDTKYFHDFILGTASIYFIKGRLHFSNSKNSAPFPSMICFFSHLYWDIKALDLSEFINTYNERNNKNAK